MHISIKTAFVASTATPLIQITFDVYASKQHFEILFTLKDDSSKKVTDANLNKIVKTLILLKSELNQAEYFILFNRLTATLDDYRLRIFSDENIQFCTLKDVEDLISQAVEAEEAKQAKKKAKSALKK